MVAEPESPALIAAAGNEELVTSVIAEVELRRAVVRRAAHSDRVEAVLAHVSLVELAPEVRRLAGGLGPAELRTLDALHLASALALGDALAGSAFYEQWLASEARQHGLDVFTPA